MSRIFISYSRSDEYFARKLAQSLSEMGAEVWIDVEAITAGMKWSSAVQQALTTCQVMLVIISPDSMASSNVEDEWQYYLDKKKPVIPVRLLPAEVHFQLNRIQYIDFYDQAYLSALERLRAELGKRGFLFNSVVTPAGAESEKRLSDDSVNPGSDERRQHSPPKNSLEGRLRNRLEGRLEKASGQINPPDAAAILPGAFEWCDIPAGSVTITYGKADQKTFKVAAFVMAKYPITNAQYQVFVDAEDGYADGRWWGFSEAAKIWRKNNAAPQKTAFAGDDLPRTNISWFEAFAFCQWLTTRAAGDLRVSRSAITLPSEQQWQRAAQGDNNRAYPWGNVFDAGRCNTRETNIGKPTPVNQYLQGASPYGVLDMIGNVWEWCLTEWQPASGSASSSIPSSYVLRGGSWNNEGRVIWCGARQEESPVFQDRFVGFRVCRIQL